MRGISRADWPTATPPSPTCAYAAVMGDTMPSCELCESGRKAFVPKSYAHAMVFHALIHHRVALRELEGVIRYVAPHGDWPENVRWRLPGPREWLYEWPRTGMRL